MHCLRVFIVVLLVYYNIYHDYFGMFIEMHVETKFNFDWPLRQ